MRKPSCKIGYSTKRQLTAVSVTVHAVSATQSNGLVFPPASVLVSAMTGQCHRYIAYERTPIQRSGARPSADATAPADAAAATSAAAASAAMTMPYGYSDGLSPA